MCYHSLAALPLCSWYCWQWEVNKMITWGLDIFQTCKYCDSNEQGFLLVSVNKFTLIILYMVYITQEQLEHMRMFTFALQASQTHICPNSDGTHPDSSCIPHIPSSRRGDLNFPKYKLLSSSNQPLSHVSICDVQRFSSGWSNCF